MRLLNLFILLSFLFIYDICWAPPSNPTRAQIDEASLLKLAGITQLSELPPLPIPQTFPPGQDENSFLEFWRNLKHFRVLTEELASSDALVLRRKRELAEKKRFLPSAQFDLALKQSLDSEISELESQIQNDKSLQKTRRDALVKFKRSNAYKKMREMELPKSYLKELLEPIYKRSLNESKVLKGRGKWIRCVDVLSVVN